MLAASHALRRFDWIMFLSTFLLEEAKHAEFFMHWHKQVVGILEPEEIASHWLDRTQTIDPSGRFVVRDVLHEALPRYGNDLMEARSEAATRPTSSAVSSASRPATTPSPRAC